MLYLGRIYEAKMWKPFTFHFGPIYMKSFLLCVQVELKCGSEVIIQVLEVVRCVCGRVDMNIMNIPKWQLKGLL